MAVLFPHDMAIRLISWSSLASSHMLFIRKIMRYPPNEIYMLYDPWKSQWFTLMIYPEKKTWFLVDGKIWSNHVWLVVYLPSTPLKNMTSSVGIIKIPDTWKKTCSKPPTSIYIHIHIMVLLFPIYGGCSWNPPMSTGSHSQDADGPEACAARCMASPQHFSPRRPRSPVSFGGLQQISWDWGGIRISCFYWLNMKLGLLNWGYPNLIATLVIETIRMNNQHLKRGTSEPTAPHRCPNILVHLSTHRWYSPTIILDINIYYIYINIYDILYNIDWLVRQIGHLILRAIQFFGRDLHTYQHRLLHHFGTIHELMTARL